MDNINETDCLCPKCKEAYLIKTSPANYEGYMCPLCFEFFTEIKEETNNENQ